MKPLTAQEFLESQHKYIFHKENLGKVLIEFAKLHVDAALKAASESADYIVETHYSGESEFTYIDKDSILNAYPESNII